MPVCMWASASVSSSVSFCSPAEPFRAAFKLRWLSPRRVCRVANFKSALSPHALHRSPLFTLQSGGATQAY